MSFHDFKDEFLKWAVPVLLTAIIAELSSLNNSMIKNESRIGFVEYRIDQHRGLLLEHTAALARNDVKIGILETYRPKRGNQ